MNETTKSYIFLKYSGISPDHIDRFKMMINGDMSRYDELRAFIFLFAKNKKAEKVIMRTSDDHTPNPWDGDWFSHDWYDYNYDDWWSYDDQYGSSWDDSYWNWDDWNDYSYDASTLPLAIEDAAHTQENADEHNYDHSGDAQDFSRKGKGKGEGKAQPSLGHGAGSICGR